MAVAAAMAVIGKNGKKRNKRSVWVKDWLLKRTTFSHVNLLTELKLEPGDWFNYLRMDEETYLELLHLVTYLIKKKNTHLREAISAHERLTVTLRYLASHWEKLRRPEVFSSSFCPVIRPNYTRNLRCIMHRFERKIS